MLRDVLQAILDEQRRTNELLVSLLTALAEGDDGGEESEPTAYLDGTPVDG